MASFHRLVPGSLRSLQGGVDALLLAVPELRDSDLHLAESRHRFAAGAVGPQPWLCGGLWGG